MQRQMRSPAVWLALILATSASLQAEDTPEPADAARSLHRQAARADDYWTCLQLEAWAAAQDKPVRLGQALGRGVQVYGDARFAFPRSVRNIWDRGETIGVVAGNRFFLMAADGRPLSMSTPIPIEAQRSAWSHNQRWVGAFRTVRSDRGSIARLAMIDTEDRSTAFTLEHNLGPNDPERWDWTVGSCAVAHDGSAIVGGVHRVAQGSPMTVVGTAAGTRVIPNVEGARAVGPHGHWLISWHPGQRRNLLIVGNQPTQIHDFAAQLGYAVVRTDDGFTLVNPEGETSTFTPAGIGIGRHPTCMSRGDFLIIGSGWGAEAPAADDFLGENTEGGQQPYTLAIYRWSEIAEHGNAAQPVLATQSRIWEDRSGPHHASILTNTDTTILRWDLSGEFPTSTELTTVPLPIEEINPSHHYYRVRHPEGVWTIIDASGTELWHGPANQAWVQTRDLVLTRHGEDHAWTYKLHGLSADPFERNEVPLQLQPGDYHVRTSRWGDQVTASGGGWWYVLNAKTGQTTDSEQVTELSQRRHPPRMQGENNHEGRWWREEGRMVPKVEAEALAAHETWVPRDAYLAGRSLVILDQRGRIYADGGRRGWQELGRANGAWSLSMSPDESTLTVSRRHHREIIAALVRGEITDDIPYRGERGKDLPHGRWRVEHNDQYVVPPAANQLEWNNEAIGFDIVRLQGTEAAGLIAITESLVLMLDGKAAKAAGTPHN